MSAEDDKELNRLFSNVERALHDMAQDDRKRLMRCIDRRSASKEATPDAFFTLLRSRGPKRGGSKAYFDPESNLQHLQELIEEQLSPDHPILGVIKAYRSAYDKVHGADEPPTKHAKLAGAPSSIEFQQVLGSQLRNIDNGSKQLDEDSLWTPVLDSRCERCYVLEEEHSIDVWKRVAAAAHRGDHVYFHGQSIQTQCEKHIKTMKQKKAVFRPMKPPPETPTAHQLPSAQTILSNTSKLRDHGLSEEDIELLKSDIRDPLGSTAKAETDAASPAINRRKVVKFKSIKVQGFGPFRDEQHFNLDFKGLGFLGADLAGVRSNGFGKTLLCATSVVWCLTGELDPHVSRVTKRNVKSVRPAKCEESFVELGGSVDGKAFKIRRTLKSKQELCVSLGGTEIKGSLGKKETTIARELFNLKSSSDLKWALPLLCAWTPFNDAGFFQAGSSEGTKRARNVIGTIVGIQPFQDKLKEDERKLKRLDKQIKEQKDKEQELRAEKEKLEAEQQGRGEQRQEDLQRQIADARKQLQCHIDALNKKQQEIEQKGPQLQKEIAEAEAEANAVEKARTTARQQHREKQAAVSGNSAEVQRWKDELDRVQAAEQMLDGKTKCPTCQQDVSNQELVQRLVQAEIERCNKNLEAAEREHKKAQNDEQAAQTLVDEKEKELTTLQGKIQKLREQKKDLNSQLLPLQRNVTKAKEDLEALEESQRKLDENCKQDDGGEAAKLERQLRDIEAGIQKTEADTKTVADSQLRLQKFIKAAQDALVEHVQERVQRWLDRFFHFHGDPEVSELYPNATSLRRSQHLTVHYEANKATSPPRRRNRGRRSRAYGVDGGTADELDAQLERLLHQPTLKWDDEDPRGIESLSTSEYARYRLAVMLALSELLRASLRINVNLLLLDECTIGMDALAILDIVVSLKRWAKKNRLCVFISTVSRFDSIGFKFDKIVAIRRSNPNTHHTDLLTAQVLQYPITGDDSDDDQDEDDEVDDDDDGGRDIAGKA